MPQSSGPVIAPHPLSTTIESLTVTDSEWAGESPSALRWMAQQMVLIRRFEEALIRLKDMNLINGPVHTSIGQEAVAVGTVSALRTSDRIAGTHRAHHQYLAKALHACAPDGLDPLKHDFSPAMYDATRELLCEIMGLAEGCSGGRGGSMHLIKKEIGVIGTNAIVGGGVPVATGFAWADRMQKRDDVTVCFFGDGAVYQGAVHEAMNLGSIWKAPVVYLVENNLYAVGTCADYACSANDLAEIAAAYGMPAMRVDGMNVLAMKRAVEEVLRRGRENRLPCVLEAEVYRFFHHAGGLPGSSFGYRTRDEELRWHDRDGISMCMSQLKRLGRIDERGIQRIEDQANRCVDAAVAYCTEKRQGDTIVVKESLWPEPGTLCHGLRDEELPERGPFVEAAALSCSREIKYSDAISEAIGRWLERDPLAFVLGEEVASFGCGPYGATKGLPAKYPDRVRNTPISEAGFCGLACGAAMNGMHPIVEIMFSSFALVAADQLMNQIGQLRHIYNGRTDIPLVARTRIASGLGYGAQHSMDPVAIFALFPGWRIFVPTTPFDYIGLFNTAMRSTSPTLFVEHHEYYNRKGLIPATDIDFRVAPGKAKIVRSGRHVTVAAYGWAVAQSLEAAERLKQEGIEAEVVDLREVDDYGLDYATIGESLKKTGMLVTAEQAPACNSIGAKIVAECQRRFYDSFDGPAISVNAPEAPMPVSRRLEQLCMPTVDDITHALRKSALRQT